MRVHSAEEVDHGAFKKKENEDNLFVFEMGVREVHVFKEKNFNCGLLCNTYPLRHLVNIRFPMVVIENHYREDDRGGHHKHDAVEVRSCNSAASPPLSYQTNMHLFCMYEKLQLTKYVYRSLFIQIFTGHILYMYITQANIESNLSQISRTTDHRSLLGVFSIEFAGVSIEFKWEETLYRGSI